MNFKELYKLVVENNQKIYVVPSKYVYINDCDDKWVVDVQSPITAQDFPWSNKGAKIKWKDKKGNVYAGIVGEIEEANDNDWAYIENVVNISKIKNKKDHNTAIDLLNI
jgi:hypothetical protein